MKKIFSRVLMNVVVFGFMSCGNSKTPATEQVKKDSVDVVEAIDTAAVDTSVVTRGGTES